MPAIFPASILPGILAKPTASTFLSSDVTCSSVRVKGRSKPLVGPQAPGPLP